MKNYLHLQVSTNVTENDQDEIGVAENDRFFEVL